MVLEDLSRVTAQIVAALAIAFATLFGPPTIGLADEPLPTGHYKFTGVKVVAIDRTKINGKTSDKESDKLTHWIRFDVRAQFERTKGTEKLPFKILNPTDRTKSRLTLDKAVKFQGKDIPVCANLLKYKKFDGRRFTIAAPDLTPLAIGSVRITSGFEIPADTYVATFEWTTSDGQIISDKVKVHIDVDLE
jgi:hypothetical protein